MPDSPLADLVKHMLRSQYGAALRMLADCVAACGDEHYEGRIAGATFRQIAYHTLFFTDFYLSATEGEFRLRRLHRRGGDERGPDLCPGLSPDETLAYARLCRRKAARSLAAETEPSLRGPSGFVRRDVSRAELHVYNIRHIQHHTGAMSAYLRRVDPRLRQDPLGELKWVGQESG